MKTRAPVTVDEGIHDQRARKHDRLVEKVADDAARAAVVPPSVHKQQLPEVRELCDGVIRGVHCLKACKGKGGGSGGKGGGGGDYIPLSEVS